MFEDMKPVIPASERTSPVVKGTLSQTSTGQVMEVDPGIGSTIKGFIMIGYTRANYNIHEYVQWEESLGDYFNAGGGYSNGGTTLKNTAFRSNAQGQCPVIQSITNGVVTIVGANANANWASMDFTWWAW